MMAPVKIIKRQAHAYLLSILLIRCQDKQHMQRGERVFIGETSVSKIRNLIARKAVSVRTAQFCQPWFVRVLLIMAENSETFHHVRSELSRFPLAALMRAGAKQIILEQS